MRFLLSIAVIVLIAGGAFLFRDRITGGADDLKVGDCFDLPTAATETVKDVQHHPCDESHTAEVFFVTTHPAAKGAPYPTKAAFDAFLSDMCGPALTAYVGTDAVDGYLAGALYPVADGWADDDRGVTCYVSLPGHAPMTSSVKAA